MSGIIILEGPDGTGKTHLAVRLVADYNAVYMHHGYHPKANWGARHMSSIRRAARLAIAGRLVVIDRLWLSGDVYASIHGDELGVTAWRGRMIHRVALTHGAITVLCMPTDPRDAIRDHSLLNERRPEMYSDISKVVRFYAEIRDGGNRWKRPECYADVLTGPDRTWADYVVAYDWRRERNQLTAFAQELVYRAMAMRNAQYQPARCRANGINVAGHQGLASHLLVGEILGPRASMLRYPFVTMDVTDRGCSSWLAMQLNRAGILEEHLLWTNALPEEGPEAQLRRLLFANPGLRVVALGRVAERVLEALRIEPHVILAHPQQQRRFRHGEPGYLDPLKKDLRKHLRKRDSYDHRK